MKILHVSSALDMVSGGGAAERTVQLSRALARAGVGCTILTTDLGLTAERMRRLEGIRLVVLPCLIKRFYIPVFSPRALWQLIRDMDVIHIIGHWSFLNAVVYLIARHLNKPYVVCPAGALPVYGRSKLIKQIYNWVVGKKIILNARGHVAITPDEIRHFAEYGVTKATISVIPNGISPEDFAAPDSEEFRKKHHLGNFPFILFLGRLNPIKGPDLLVRAFCNIKNQFPDYHLVLAGPDEGMLSSLKEIVAECGALDRVHFIGYIDGNEKSWAIRASSLLVIPSRQEAMSIVVLEAGSSGIPVLLTDKCGFDDIGRVGGGRVVSATIEGIQLGLVELLSKPSDLKHMGSRLKEFVNAGFTWNSIIQKYIVVYDDILFRPQS